MARMRQPEGDDFRPGGPDGDGRNPGDDSPFPIPPVPDDPNNPDGRHGETPRERKIPDAPLPLPPPTGDGPYDDSAHNKIDQPGGDGDPNGGQATTSRPRTPTSMAGSVSPVQSGMQPFNPMGDMSTSSGPQMALGRLFGQAGGLKGGGLGVPLDPTSNQMSDPINQLLKMITGGGGGQF